MSFEQISLGTIKAEIEAIRQGGLAESSGVTYSKHPFPLVDWRQYPSRDIPFPRSGSNTNILYNQRNLPLR